MYSQFIQYTLYRLPLKHPRGFYAVSWLHMFLNFSSLISMWRLWFVWKTQRSIYLSDIMTKYDFFWGVHIIFGSQNEWRGFCVIFWSNWTTWFWGNLLVKLNDVVYGWSFSIWNSITLILSNKHYILSTFNS
jgi:hypothetical protein